MLFYRSARSPLPSGGSAAAACTFCGGAKAGAEPEKAAPALCRETPPGSPSRRRLAPACEGLRGGAPRRPRRTWDDMNMMSHRQGSAPRAPWSYHSVRLLVLTAMPAMLGLLLLMTVRSANYLTDATRAVLFPFGLDYGEGIVWQQALLIPGPQMYGKITQPPFIVFEYPPVYHLLVRGIATLGIDPLAAGREYRWLRPLL